MNKDNPISAETKAYAQTGRSNEEMLAMMKYAPAPGFWREFDLRYWQMREALGYSIPDRIDRRFPRKLQGNLGDNPFACGKCGARRLFPKANITAELEHLRDTLPPEQWQEIRDHLMRYVFDERSQ